MTAARRPSFGLRPAERLRNMSCYYHPKVPTLTRCTDCGHEICATCAVDSLCPGCRLGRAMRRGPLEVQVQTKGSQTDFAGRFGGDHFAGTATATAASVGNGASHANDSASVSQPAAPVAEAPPSEDKLLAALCYPLWPLALLLLVLRGKRPQFVRYHALQALFVNALGVAAYFVYSGAGALPVVGWQSNLVLPLLLPAWFILDLYLAVRAYGGHMTRVPLAAEYASRYADS